MAHSVLGEFLSRRDMLKLGGAAAAAGAAGVILAPATQAQTPKRGGGPRFKPPPPPTITLSEPADCGSVDLANSTVTDSTSFIALQPRTTWNNKWWWYFAKLDNVLDRTLTVELPMASSHNAMNGAFRWGFWSYTVNGPWQAWDSVSFLSSPNRVRLSKNVAFTQNTIYIALYPPYTTAMLEADILSYKAHPFVHPTASANSNLVIGTVGSIASGTGRTVSGMNLYGFRIEDTSYTGAKNHGLVVGGIHPGEHNAMWTGRKFIEFWLSDDPDAVYLRTGWVLYVYPDTNPQGRNGGLWRNAPDALAYDYNRIWGNTHSATQVKFKDAIAADAPSSLHFATDFHGYHQAQSPGTSQHIADAISYLTATSRKHPEFKTEMIAAGAGSAWDYSSITGIDGMFHRHMQYNNDDNSSLAVCVTLETGAKNSYFRSDYENHGEAVGRALAAMTLNGDFPISPEP